MHCLQQSQLVKLCYGAAFSIRLMGCSSVNSTASTSTFKAHNTYNVVLHGQKHYSCPLQGDGNSPLEQLLELTAAQHL